MTVRRRPTHARYRRPVPRLVVGTVVAAVAFGGTLGACRVAADPAPAVTVTASPEISGTREAAPAPARPARFTVLAAGDLLPHGAVVTSAGGGDRFGPLLAGIDPWVEGADLALCHLEVPVAPAGTAPSGYPLFGAPDGLVPALAAQGWDGCSTASNHSVDRGYDGVVTTLDALDDAGMGHVGTARSAAEKKAPQLYEVERAGRTLTVAHLSATYGLNGLPMPAQAPWAATLLDAGDLVAQAERARRAGADLVLVSMHAGVEYTETLTDQQVDVVAALAESGAVDLVIGHHAHVPQRIEKVPGGPDGDGLWVAYGLGNLLSNQSAACCDARTSNGVLLIADVVQERPGGPTRVAEVTWTGSTVDIAAGHRVHALPDVLADAGATTLSAGELRAREERVAAAVGDDAAERTTAPEATGPAPEVVERTG